MRSRERLSERLGECPDLLLCGPSHDRHIHVNAFGACRLCECRHAEPIECVVDDQRSVEDFEKARARHWIEIEVQVVRSIDVITARIPWIEIDASEIDDP